jgi:hypothetical protein
MEDDKKYIFTEEEKKKIKEDAEKYGRHTVGCGTDNKEPFLNETLKKDSPS